MESTIIDVDPEGGRVRRLTVPTFEMRPAAETFGKIAEEEGIEVAYAKCKENYKNIGLVLKEVGFNANFAPVADIRHEGAHDIIGDRSFSTNPEVVVALCKAALEGLKEAGVLGVIKHIPGHGGSKQDSHDVLPTIETSLEELEATDFYVFKQLASECKVAMTAHINYIKICEIN